MADDKKKQPIIIKKKKGGHGGAHGGAWKIAYADLVTAMMAFFLVMWIIGMDVQTKQGIATYFQNLTARATHTPASPFIINMSGAPPVRPNPKPPMPRDSNMDAQNAGVLKSQIESLIGSSPQFERLRAAVDMQIGEKDMRIEFHDGGGESLFVGETAQLRPEARRLMEGVAALLNKKRAKLSLEGHAPSRGGTGIGQGEWEVSTSRAVALRGALASGGVDDERIIEVKGLGDTKPKIPEDPSNAANRRVAIVMPYDVPDG